MELVRVEPDGLLNLAHDESDAYRVEIDAILAAILTGALLTYGTTEAVEWARMLEAIRDFAH
jgi:Flp pilus assembly pilin Flp